MKNQLLPISRSEMPEHSGSTDSLIREWLFRFGVEHKEDVAPRLPLWLEAFSGIDSETLEALFKKTLKTCKFFPKISEILAPLESVKKAALPEEASEAWLQVLSIRRQHFNSDFPQHLVCALESLPERVRRAARASGVFQEVSDPDQLHVWAKKRFIESYLAWEEIEESKFLLPNGKNFIASLLARPIRALLSNREPVPFSSEESSEILAPESSVLASEPSKFTPRIAVERRQANPIDLIIKPIEQPARFVDVERRSAELKRQAELIQQKYPKPENSAGISPELRPKEVSV
jgi:hypothetical protein